MQPATQFDAVLIPGGGLAEDGGLPAYVKARFDLALQQNTRYWIALSAATPHRTPRPRFESHAGAEYLVSRGVPASQVMTETSSFDTIGNAWFARMLHAEPAGLRNLLVINSEFHIERTEVVFRWIFGATPNPGYVLSFAASQDIGISPAGLEERRRKEQTTLARMRMLASRLTTLPGLHHWIYSEHECYAVGLGAQAFRPKSGKILETY